MSVLVCWVVPRIAEARGVGHPDIRGGGLCERVCSSLCVLVRKRGARDVFVARTFRLRPGGVEK